MIFIGYIEGNEVDLLVNATNGNEIEYYFTLEELLEDCGEDAEYSTIHIMGVSVEDLDGNLIFFDSIGLN